MVHSYAWNSLWVFAKEHTNDIVSFIKFVIVSMSGLVMSSVLFWVMLEIHINDWVVKLSMMFFLFVWNFAGDKWWVYTKK
jgi:putative flippase GtrA